MRRTLITEAKRKHTKAKAALRKAERKYSAIARKYDRIIPVMMAANEAVGKASEAEQALSKEVRFYEQQLAKLKAKPHLSAAPIPRLTLAKAPPPKRTVDPPLEHPKPRKKRAKKKSKPKASKKKAAKKKGGKK